MTEDQAFDNFIGRLILDNTTLTSGVLDEIHRLFPANDPANGAPFNTGDSLFDRAEAWYTVNMYLAPRRLFFDKAAGLSTQPFFAYFFDEFIPGNNPSLGGTWSTYSMAITFSYCVLPVFHGSELSLLFGPVPTPVEEDFANTMLDFYISFVTDLNPGGRL